MYAIECRELSKSYQYRQKKFAVQHLNLQVAPRQVYGFLGQNGAGKTTTIRMLLDLIRPSQGSAYIMGQPVWRNPAALQQVGALIEGASFYPYLSAWDNLEVLGRTFGSYDPARTQRMIELVGLQGRERQRVGKFSTGMKQRLGIAAAILHDPAVVILDEPGNGLDPAGIHELRSFMRRLVEEDGKTVFFSSHQLAEVQLVCDRVAIINNGRLIAEGSVQELLHQSGASQVLMQVAPLDKAQSALSERWKSKLQEDGLLVTAPQAEIPAIIRALVAAEVDIFGVQPQQNTLESIFLRMTEGATS